MTETATRTADVMDAARAVSAMASRVAFDSELATDLIHAQHAGDVDRMQELLHRTGVPAKVALAGDQAPPATGVAPDLRISGGITISHGGDGWDVSVTLTLSKD